MISGTISAYKNQDKLLIWKDKMETLQETHEEKKELLQERINELDNLRKSNLDFFKEFHPVIYDRFLNFKLDRYKLNLITENGQLDLLLDGKTIYNGRPLAEAREELSNFSGKFSEGNNLNTVHPPFDGYCYPRYFHKSCTDILEESPLKQGDFKGYTIPDFYPIMIFNGVGAGYHVEEFLRKNKVINCLIVEPATELFAASLYIVDWKKTCQPFLDNKERNIHFIIGPIDNEFILQNMVCKYLNSHCPLYPLTTFFNNHKNIDIYNRLTQKVNEDTQAFVSVWGYYDDEINQLNNCLHNLHLNIPVIKQNKSNIIDLPVFIIGGGPSLDEKIKKIKEFKDKCIIISCGTSLHTLYRNNIKPDIHLELESHLVTLRALDELNDHEWVKGIPMIGPAQLSPRVFNYFNNKAIYFKGESVTSFLFGEKYNSVNKGTPTCTNAALALFLHWGFKNIFLFGMDFGYRDLAKHHASGSVYYDTKDKDMLEDADVEKVAIMEIDCVRGRTIKTKPMLYTAKRTAEAVIYPYRSHASVYNCSDGAVIDGTEWIFDDELPDIFTESNKSMKNEFISLQFDNNSNKVDLTIIQKRLDVLDHNIVELNNYMIDELNKIEPNLYSLTSIINSISSFLENKMKPEIPPFYYFLRGSIWHLFYIGYSHALAIEEKSLKEQWIITWRKKTIETLNGLHKHYQKIVFKEFNLEEDIWTSRSTSDPEN